MQLGNQENSKKAKVASALLLASVVFLSAIGPAMASGTSATSTHKMASGSELAYPA